MKMHRYISNRELWTNRARFKPSEAFKKRAYVSFFVVSSIVFSGSTLAKTVCSTEVVKDDGTPTLSAEFIDAMHDAISTSTFVLDEPYTVITKRKFCTDVDEVKVGTANFSDTINGAADPSATPQEGDTRSVSQTRSDGIRTWTYTHINGVRELTEYSFTPTIDNETLPVRP